VCGRREEAAEREIWRGKIWQKGIFTFFSLLISSFRLTHMCISSKQTHLYLSLFLLLSLSA
jgi:hypothetical protein